MKIARYITEFNTERNIDDLPKIVQAYNFTKHRGLNYRTPTDIHLLTEWSDIVTAFKLMYKYRKKRVSKSLSTVLRKGAHVRIVSSYVTKNRFFKEANIRNTREIFKIAKINRTHPVTYSLQDLENKRIDGGFYKEELIPVENSGKYRIEILRTREKGGKIEYLVKSIDYPQSCNKWVDRLE